MVRLSYHQEGWKDLGCEAVVAQVARRDEGEDSLAPFAVALISGYLFILSIVLYAQM